MSSTIGGPCSYDASKKELIDQLRKVEIIEHDLIGYKKAIYIPDPRPIPDSVYLGKNVVLRSHEALLKAEAAINLERDDDPDPMEVIVTLKIPKGTKIAAPKYDREASFNLIMEYIKLLQNCRAGFGDWRKYVDEYAWGFHAAANMMAYLDDLYKCRTSKAEVIDISPLSTYYGAPVKITKAQSHFDCGFMYRLGETVRVPDFDETTDICEAGIHFFMSREEAEAYEF